MCLDAGTVFKRYFLCPHCKEDYLFTLRAIAHNPELRCHGCGGSRCRAGEIYLPYSSHIKTSATATKR